MKGKLFYGIFFGIFVVVGLCFAIYGFVQLARFHLAEKVSATVISAEYDYLNDKADVTFTYMKDGVSVERTVRFKDAEIKNGEYPYYAGKEILLRLDGSGTILQFGKAETIATVTGCLFFIVGVVSLYFGILRKPGMMDYAYTYEQAIVSPDEVTDATAKYEARADELTRLDRNSPERIAGEMNVWGNRIRDRFRVYTVWQHLLFACYFILPGILLGLYPLFAGRTVTVGRVFTYVLIWFFAACLLGMVGKFLGWLYWCLLVKCRKFKEKQLATVVCCAFESALYFQVGNLSRTHMIFKKFRVVATVNGKRSIGYVKGNLPPAQGALLKVLIRPGRYGHWIIDKEQK